ncbi:MAG TPA: DUF4249 family protein [Prolixibacteraceae bacterium]|nr:DUF4249 family protein [Prolixibacteraceae bacterium]
MKAKPFFYLIVLLAPLNSCVREIDLDFGKVPVYYVVSAMLNPDSVFRVNLSRSLRVDQPGPFPLVNDAVVEVSGGGSTLRLIPDDKGNYLLAQKPQKGMEYDLKISCADGTILRASTKVPEEPVVSVLPLPAENYLQVTIIDRTSTEDFYWVGIRGYDAEDKKYYFETYVESNFLSFDDFNRTKTIDRFGRNTWGYHFYARLPDLSFQGKQAVFKIPWYWLPEGEPYSPYWKNFLYIINADRHLDQYLKTAVIQYELGVIGDMPVFYTPIDMYGNISSGKGIFGSCTFSQFDVTQP